METRKFAEFELSHLMLGTAQFGLDYGIANKTGQPSYKEARDIIARAYEGGVNCLDTAAIYGSSEEVVGHALAELGIADKVMVETKVLHMADGLSATDADAIVEESVTESLRRLRLDALPICLSHTERNFLHYSESLLKMKEKGLVRHVGSSVESTEMTARIVESGSAEAVQVPANILDHRFDRIGVLDAAASRGIAVFIRSIYLQGLILMPESEILPEHADAVPVRRKLQSLAGEAGIGLAELAVRYILSLPQATCVLVGVDSAAQMRENLDIFSKGPLDPAIIKAVTDAVPDLPEGILNPRTWSKKMADVKPAAR